MPTSHISQQREMMADNFSTFIRTILFIIILTTLVYKKLLSRRSFIKRNSGSYSSQEKSLQATTKTRCSSTGTASRPPCMSRCTL